MDNTGTKIIKSSDDFISEIKKQLDLGYGFTPFIGSGMSAPSGIMTGLKFNEYLTYVIYRCLGKPDYESTLHETKTSNAPDYWNLKKYGWPDYPHEEQLRSCKEWVRRGYMEACDKANFKIEADSIDGYFSTKESHNSYLNRPLCPAIFSPDETLKNFDQVLAKNNSYFVNSATLAYDRESSVSPREFSYIKDVAVRVMHDWRAMLEFLSKLNVVEDNLLEISETRDSFVVDSFNNHIVWGRKPNMTHFILTYLTSTLRIRHILTTNFDSLIEDAFRQVRIPLQVLPVTKSGGLPAAVSVWSKSTLLKLHGDVHDTRADYSLDDHPDSSEKATFMKYLWPEGEDDIFFQCSHLLIMGASASDGRTVELIKFILESRKEFKVFWLAYNDKDEEKVTDIFRQVPGNNRVIIHQSKHLALLLYHLHQSLSLSLPQGGFRGQLNHYLPPVLTRNKVSEDYVKSIAKEINTAFSKFAMAPFQDLIKRDDNSNIRILDGGSGVGNLANQLFQHMSVNKTCIWLELESFTKPIIFVAEILKVIVTHVGSVHYENVNIKLSHPEEFNEETLNRFTTEIINIVQYLSLDTRDWVFFIYGRNIPGSCSGWTNQIWNKEDVQAFHSIIKVLGKLGFGIIYMPFSKIRLNETVKKKVELTYLNGGIEFHPIEEQQWFAPEEEIIDETSFKDIAPPPIEVPSNFKDGLSFNHILTYGVEAFLDTDKAKYGHHARFEEVVTNNNNILDEKAFKKISFLYAATLLRSPRDLTALISEAIYPCPYRYNRDRLDNDLFRMRDVSAWLQQLRKHNIFYNKSGGASWAYQDIRIGLNYLIEKLKKPETAENKERFNSVKNRGARARTHFWIAEWYVKSFHSTNHNSQLIEAIYHWFSCIRNIKYATPRALRKDEIKRLTYRIHLLITSLMQITKVIKASRTTLVFWIHGFQDWQLFTEEKILNALDIKNRDELSLNTADWFASVLGYRRDKLPELWEKKKSPPANDTEETSINTDISIEEYTQYVKRFVELLLKESKKVEIELNRSKGKFVNVDRYGAANKSHNDKFTELKPLNLNISSASWWPIDNNSDNTTDNFSDTILYHIKSVYEYRAIAEKANDKTNKTPPDSQENNLEQSIQQDIDNFEKLTKYIKTYLTSDDSRPVDDEGDAKDKLISDFNMLKQQWILKTLGYSEGLLSLTTIISEMTYLYIKRVKIDTRSKQASIPPLKKFINIGGLDPTSDHSKQDLTAKYWIVICSLCWLGLDLLKNLPPNFIQEELRLKCKFLSFYGMALAYLGRFYEGSRRFSEGQSLLFNAVDRGSNEQAMLRLRRSELHLLQGIALKSLLQGIKQFLAQHKDKTKVPVDALFEERKSLNEEQLDRHNEVLRQYAVGFCDDEGNVLQEVDLTKVIKITYRRHIAKLDDALTSCETTEYLMSGLNHSLLCWERLYILKLRMFAAFFSEINKLDEELTQIPLIFRRRIEYHSHLEDLLNKGLLLCKDDAYGRLRFLAQYADAIQSLKRFLQTKKSNTAKIFDHERLMAELEDCEKAELSDICKNFYASVDKKLTALNEQDDSPHILM